MWYFFFIKWMYSKRDIIGEEGKTTDIDKPSPTRHFPEGLDLLDIHFIQWQFVSLTECVS